MREFQTLLVWSGALAVAIFGWMLAWRLFVLMGEAIIWLRGF